MSFVIKALYLVVNETDFDAYRMYRVYCAAINFHFLVFLVF